MFLNISILHNTRMHTIHWQFIPPIYSPLGKRILSNTHLLWPFTSVKSYPLVPLHVVLLKNILLTKYHRWRLVGLCLGSRGWEDPVPQRLVVWAVHRWRVRLHLPSDRGGKWRVRFILRVRTEIAWYHRQHMYVQLRYTRASMIQLGHTDVRHFVSEPKWTSYVKRPRDVAIL